jgi:aspartate kinase
MNKAQTLVMKFGGASLATPEHFDHVANLVLKRHEQYEQIVIVVSAMGKTTDELLQLAKKIHPTPPQRELDMLLSVGERISMSLLAMSIEKKGKQAVSFTGSQSGIITCSRHSDAKIIDVKPYRLLNSFQQNKIVIVAGFQGVSRQGEITTLGRGGSDTTAVALGAALNASCVEFYKDVPGLCEKDPKIDPHSALFSTISYDDAIDIVSKGAKILHLRSLLLAKQNGIPLHIRSFKQEYEELGGTKIKTDSRTKQPLKYEEEI